MENSYRFFQNDECQFFPCHQGDLKDFNCLFCYCPMYRLEKCLGNPTYMQREDRTIKVCTNCTFPHQPENYDAIMELLKNSL